MSRFSTFALGLALPVSLLSQPVFADLTPAQVWGDWRSYMEGMGYDVSASETASGDDLTVSGITLAIPGTDGKGSMRMSVGDLQFNQNSDGTVAIVMPGTMPITVEGMESSETGAPVTMTLDYTQSGHALTASGTPTEVTYLYTAASVGVRLTEMTSGTQTLGPEEARFSVTGSNLRSTTNMSIGDIRTYEQTGGLDGVSYDFFFRNPEKPDAEGTVTGSISDLTFTGNGTIPRDVPADGDVAALMRAGFSGGGIVGFGAGTSDFDIKDPESGSFVVRTTTTGGSLGVVMGMTGLAYDARQTGLKVTMNVEGMPFPIEFGMAESGFNLTMPVAKSDAPQDFALGLTLGEFTMSDMIWGMFDPAGQLPRDPASVILDLSGKVKLLVDWMNPEIADELDSAPGEVQALSLNNLLVSLAGARLDGSGAVTFDGAGDPMLPGVGNPVGEVNLNLAGGNGLLDKLVAMGFVPQDQAMGARMMMGLFAVPGDAPDTLKSRIEFTKDGQILANGQRIR